VFDYYYHADGSDSEGGAVERAVRAVASAMVNIRTTIALRCFSTEESNDFLSSVFSDSGAAVSIPWIT
jgi:hypothetical protein